jgi:hypothetical protein
MGMQATSSPHGNTLEAPTHLRPQGVWGCLRGVEMQRWCQQHTYVPKKPPADPSNPEWGPHHTHLADKMLSVREGGCFGTFRGFVQGGKFG